MIRINNDFCKLPAAYLFTEVARRVEAYRREHPEAHIIKMGLGDVTIPVAAPVIEAMHRAVDDEASRTSFHGYGPEQGYAFLRDAIAEGDYRSRGIEGITAADIFISDGAKSDLGNIADILAPDVTVAVTDPVYPVYVDTNVMGGRGGSLLPDGRWSRILYLPCTADNDFIPALPTERVDVIYLCYPNNPTGTTLTRRQLKAWIDYALAHGSLLLFDSAYEAFVNSPDVPHSIYEIEGARRCAIEFRSFSKTAGFTGIRCGYTVVPAELRGIDAEGREVGLRELWNRRQCTKFNGASYIAQRGAEALYIPAGRSAIASSIGTYLATAAKLRTALEAAGLRVWGGTDSPYLWVKTPDGLGSWEFFDMLLRQKQIVCTPGAGFGPSGEGYVRFTAFNVDGVDEAAARLSDRI